MRVYMATSPKNFAYAWTKPITTNALKRNNIKSVNLLGSYWYWKNNNIGEFLEEKGLTFPLNFFIDSGGFSAWSQGVEIKVDDYIEWIMENAEHIDEYANLDIRGDWEKTKDNQLRMEEAGLNPLPVFHAGEPERELHKMLEKYKHIAIGGIAGHFQERKLTGKWLVKYFKAKGAGTKYHGFGLASPWICERFPFYSVDSTSWVYGAIIGQLCYWNYDKNKISYFKLGRDNPFKASKHIRQMGFDPKPYGDMMRVEKDMMPEVAGLGIVTYMLYAKHITEYWKKGGIKYECC